MSLGIRRDTVFDCSKTGCVSLTSPGTPKRVRIFLPYRVLSSVKILVVGRVTVEDIYRFPNVYGFIFLTTNFGDQSGITTTINSDMKLWSYDR